jgi:hypothetical protein
LGAPTAVYRASISAAPGGAGFVVTLTDCGVINGSVSCSSPPAPLIAFDNLHQATVTLGVAPDPTKVSASPSWSVAVNGNVVTVTATGSDLTVGQSVNINLPIPTVAGPDSIATSATDANGFTFTRNGNDPTYGVNLAYVNPPAESALNSAIDAASGGVQVSASDTLGSPDPGVAVGIAVGSNSAGGALSGTTTQLTNASGIATFGDLKLSVAGFGYTLVASNNGQSITSNPFTIASSFTLCTTASCTGSATDTAGVTTATGSLSGLTGKTNLYLTMYNLSTYTPFANACGKTGFEGSGTRVDVTDANGNTAAPTKTVTWRLDKSIVNQTPNNGAAQYSICLGAVNTANPTQSWVTKGGGTAVLEPDGKFWGFAAACGSVPSGQPCITSQSKNGQGDVVITISIPSPWDEQIVGGLLGTVSGA